MAIVDTLTTRIPSLRSIATLVRQKAAAFGLVAPIAPAVDQVTDGLDQVPTVVPADVDVATLPVLLAEQHADQQLVNDANARIRARKKTISRLPNGTWGEWTVSRERGALRMDQPAVRALLTTLGRVVPNKRDNPTLRITRAQSPDA